MAHVNEQLALHCVLFMNIRTAAERVPPSLAIRQVVLPQDHLPQEVVLGKPVPVPHAYYQLIPQPKLRELEFLVPDGVACTLLLAGLQALFSKLQDAIGVRRRSEEHTSA